jgi:hypothetical protein
MNQTEAHYMHIWKCHNEISCTTIIDYKSYFIKLVEETDPPDAQTPKYECKKCEKQGNVIPLKEHNRGPEV